MARTKHSLEICVFLTYKKCHGLIFGTTSYINWISNSFSKLSLSAIFLIIVKQPLLSCLGQNHHPSPQSVQIPAFPSKYIQNLTACYYLYRYPPPFSSVSQYFYPGLYTTLYLTFLLQYLLSIVQFPHSSHSSSLKTSQIMSFPCLN